MTEAEAAQNAQNNKLIKNSSSQDGEIKEEKEQTIAEEEKEAAGNLLGGVNDMAEKALDTVQNLPGMKQAE